MTFEQIFSGRMLLMRAQRHVAQSGIETYIQGSWLQPVFRSAADRAAFCLIEKRLQELEREFDEKAARKDHRKRQLLRRRIDRQVTAQRRKP